MARSSQANSKCPSEGSMVDHANAPTRATCMWACCMSRRSASQRCSGHCSGYQAVPSKSGDTLAEGVEIPAEHACAAQIKKSSAVRKRVLHENKMDLTWARVVNQHRGIERNFP